MWSYPDGARLLRRVAPRCRAPHTRQRLISRFAKTGRRPAPFIVFLSQSRMWTLEWCRMVRQATIVHFPDPVHDLQVYPINEYINFFLLVWLFWSAQRSTVQVSYLVVCYVFILTDFFLDFRQIFHTRLCLFTHSLLDTYIFIFEGERGDLKVPRPSIRRGVSLPYLYCPL